MHKDDYKPIIVLFSIIALLSIIPLYSIIHSMCFPPSPPTYSDPYSAPIKIVEFLIGEREGIWGKYEHIAVLGHVNGTQIIFYEKDYESVQVGDYVRTRSIFTNVNSRGYDPSYGCAKVYRNGTYIGEFSILFKDWYDMLHTWDNDC